MVLKRKSSKKLSEKHKSRIRTAIKKAEDKLMANYKKVSGMTGEDWKKASKKYRLHVKKDMAKARKRIDSEVRKNPEGATIAAAVIGALAGAIIMSKLKRK